MLPVSTSLELWIWAFEIVQLQKLLEEKKQTKTNPKKIQVA